MPPDATGLIHHPDACARCWWAGLDPVYTAYHDPERDGDHFLFSNITELSKVTRCHIDDVAINSALFREPQFKIPLRVVACLA